MLEFGAELSDIYGELFELELKKKQKSMEKLNKLALKSIENGNVFTSIIYKKDDPSEKFEYVQSMINLELSAGSKLTKYITADVKERLQKTKEALDKYNELNAYIQEYFKFKKINTVSEVESEQMRHQIEIVQDMVSLLPQKLDKMSASLNYW